MCASSSLRNIRIQGSTNQLAACRVTRDSKNWFILSIQVFLLKTPAFLHPSSQPAASMVSINDALPSELVFLALTWLMADQVFKMRRVCKSWKEIIDEDRAFWQILIIERKED